MCVQVCVRSKRMIGAAVADQTCTQGYVVRARILPLFKLIHAFLPAIRAFGDFSQIVDRQPHEPPAIAINGSWQAAHDVLQMRCQCGVSVTRITSPPYTHHMQALCMYTAFLGCNCAMTMMIQLSFSNTGGATSCTLKFCLRPLRTA